MPAADTAEGARRTDLRDGSTVWIRPVEGGDKARIADAFSRMSETTRRRRFLVPARRLSEEDLEYLTDVDHRRHEALVALDEGGGRVVGVTRYVRVPRDPEAAEVAVVVVDEWQGRGLATELLEQLTEVARRNGLRRYKALVSSDNRIVIEALDRLGAARFGVTDAGEIEYGIDFPAQGIGSRLREALRGAAGGRLDSLAGLARRLNRLRRP